MSKQTEIAQLVAEGWEIFTPEIDISRINLWNAGKFISTVSNELFNVTRHPIANIIALFSETVSDSWDTFIVETSKCNIEDEGGFYYISVDDTTRNTGKVNNSNNKPHILDLLQLSIIYRIVNLLGLPNSIIQYVWDDSRRVFLSHDRNVDVAKLTLVGTIEVKWDNATCIIHTQYGETPRIRVSFADETTLHSYIDKAASNLAAYITSDNYQIGYPNANYELSSFVNNAELTNVINDKVKQLELGEINKLNVILTGEPGVGKTSWSNSYCKEVLSKLGYIIINMDSASMRSFTPPAYLSKIAIVVNDADNIAPSRTSNNDGATEKMLSWLDGNVYTAITPFKQTRLPKIITIFTCNTTERWDIAAMREGRIDFNYPFVKEA
jgi:hypothetical protein